MPRATVSQEPIRKDLKSCPGGYVVLRQLPYGDVLARRDGAVQMVVEQGGDPKKDNPRTLIESMQTWAREFEFRNCILDHNLEDENGQKLDFNNPLTFKALDSRIGAEIETYIDELNGEDDDNDDAFTHAASSLSAAADALTKPENDTDLS